MKNVSLKPFLVCISIIFFSCSTTFLDKKEQPHKEAFIKQVKLLYFKKCLAKSFHNKAIKKLNRIDKSGMQDKFFRIQLYRKIDSLSTLMAKRIVKDSALSIGHVSEGAEGKRVYATCLEAYTSHWLDSLARSEYKRYKEGR